MPEDLKESGCPHSEHDSAILNKKFKFDGNILIATGFFTGPHKTVFVLSLCLAFIALVLLADIFFFAASISMIIPVAVFTLLAVLLFRTSYIRTMPFEIQINRSTDQLRISRPDIPDIFFNAQYVKTGTQRSDIFTKKTDPWWLVAELPNGKRFFLTDAKTLDGAEAIRTGLDQWLNITIPE